MARCYSIGGAQRRMAPAMAAQGRMTMQQQQQQGGPRGGAYPRNAGRYHMVRLLFVPLCGVGEGGGGREKRVRDVLLASDDNMILAHS